MPILRDEVQRRNLRPVFPTCKILLLLLLLGNVLRVCLHIVVVRVTEAGQWPARRPLPVV